MTAVWMDNPAPPAVHPPPGTWAEQAACRHEDPDLFYPPDEEHGRYAVLQEALAKRICLGCPVLAACTAHALATDERYGVWGFPPPNATGCAAAAPDQRGTTPDPGETGDRRRTGQTDSGQNARCRPSVTGDG